MITQSILVQIAFWWSATTIMVGCVVVPRQRVTAPDNGVSGGGGGNGTDDDVPFTTVAAAVSEESVHLLTAVGFPPPALLVADPGKKWTLSDFQKPPPGRSNATYSVTDEPDHAVEDWATAAAPPPEPEPEATTAVATADDGQRLTGDGEAATTAIADDRGHDDDDDDDDGATTTIATVPAVTAAAASAVTPAPVATVDTATAAEADGPPPTGHHWPPRPVHVHQHDGPPAGWPVRQTVAAYYLHRGRYPVAVVGRPYQTIALSFRPVRAPPSSAGFRFPKRSR